MRVPFEETRGGSVGRWSRVPPFQGERPSAEMLSFVFSIFFPQGLGVGPDAFCPGRSVLGAVGPSSSSLLRDVSRPWRAAGLPSRPALCAPAALSGPPRCGRATAPGRPLRPASPPSAGRPGAAKGPQPCPGS